MSDALSREEVRDRLSRAGKTTVDVAHELNVSPATVRGVIDGRFKGNRGDAHKVAVALGLKVGVIVADDMPIAEALKAVATR